MGAGRIAAFVHVVNEGESQSVLRSRSISQLDVVSSAFIKLNGDSPLFATTLSYFEIRLASGDTLQLQCFATKTICSPSRVSGSNWSVTIYRAPE